MRRANDFLLSRRFFLPLGLLLFSMRDTKGMVVMAERPKPWRGQSYIIADPCGAGPYTEFKTGSIDGSFVRYVICKHNLMDQTTPLSPWSKVPFFARRALWLCKWYGRSA